MKKKILKLLLLGVFIPFGVNAASISCSGGGTVTLGNTFSVTFTGNYNGTALWRIEGIDYNSNVVTNLSGFSTIAVDGSLSTSYTFKASNIGSSSIRLIRVDVADSGNDGSQLIGPGGASSACSVNVVAQSSGGNSNKTNTNSNGSSSKSNTNTNLSSNNNLSSIKIEGVNLLPEFSKSTLEYSAEVDNTVEKINIEATADDGGATISGLGEKELEEGINTFEIVVTAPNGASKTYTLNITKAEKDPIKIKIGKETFTVLRKIDGIDIPDDFEETTVKINDENVQGLKSSNSKVILVALLDKDSKASWYIYDEKTRTYSKYVETKNGLKLALLTSTNTPVGFHEKTIYVNNEKIKAFVSDANNKFIIVYAKNLKTGEDDFYIYDEANNGFILYNSDIYSPVINSSNLKGIMSSLKNSGSLIYIIVGFLVIVLLCLLLILLTIKNKNMKTFIEKQRIKNSDKEEQTKEEKIELDDDNILDLDETIDISNDATVIKSKLLDEEKNKPKNKKTRKK